VVLTPPDIISRSGLGEREKAQAKQRESIRDSDERYEERDEDNRETNNKIKLSTFKTLNNVAK